MASGASAISSRKIVPPLASSNFPRPGLDARRHAPLDAEELGLEEGLGNGRAVEGQEGGVAARRGGVEEPGDELLAGAALAPHQDADPRRGGPDDELLDAPHPRRLPDEKVVDAERPLQRAVLLAQAVDVGLERAELPKRVEGRRRERRDRLEEAPVPLVEGGAGPPAGFPVERDDDAEDPVPHDERRPGDGSRQRSPGPSRPSARAGRGRGRGRGRTGRRPRRGRPGRRGSRRWRRRRGCRAPRRRPRSPSRRPAARRSAPRSRRRAPAPPAGR